MPVIRDLIVDMDAVHWKKIQRVTPWLINKEPVPEREYIVPHENMVDVTQTMACIQCGACVSDCLSMEVDPLFIGPAALAKAYRFVGDPRDAEQYERLKDLSEDEHGIYDCTHCFNCIDACPKGVAPMSQIMRLRRIAGSDYEIEDRNNGYRHEHAFVKNIRRERPAARGRPAARLLRRQVPPARGPGAAQLAADRGDGAAARQDDADARRSTHPHKASKEVKKIFDDDRGTRAARRAEPVRERLRGRGRAAPRPAHRCRDAAASHERKRELMKVAYWPGCVSRGFTPELHGSMAKVAPLLDIELIELDRAACCGAGVIAEHNQELADTLNARTFALAQQTDGELMMNICSTCQGAQSECQERLDANTEYREQINANLVRRGPHATRRACTNKNFLWLLVEEIGLDALKAKVKRPLTDLRVGPFYGCYIVRPVERLGIDDEHPRDRYLHMVIEALGGTVIDYAGVYKCCGFPIITMNKQASLDAGRPPPRRRDRRRGRLPRRPVPALPPQPRSPAAARRQGRRPRARDAGAPSAAARRARARALARRSSG